MENNELNILINAFKGYRDLLSPIQENLKDFADTFVSMRDDIEKLNQAFDKESKGNLDHIYKSLARQSENAQELATKIESFNKETGRYNSIMSRIANTFEQIEGKMSSLSEIETKANDQLAKLEGILEEKKKSYNVRDLERSLENYNTNVKKISEFVNKDVAESINASQGKLDTIRTSSGEMLENMKGQNADLEKLIGIFETTNGFLKNIVETESVNEVYLYEVLDKWAAKRKVKVK